MTSTELPGNRKAVSIAAANGRLHAVCDDGTIWEYASERSPWNMFWRKLPHQVPGLQQPVRHEKHERFPVSEFIRDELIARKWKASTLAEKSGLSVAVVRGVLAGDVVTPEIASGLGAAFGTTAKMWLCLQQSFQGT